MINDYELNERKRRNRFGYDDDLEVHHNSGIISRFIGGLIFAAIGIFIIVTCCFSLFYSKSFIPSSLMVEEIKEDQNGANLVKVKYEVEGKVYEKEINTMQEWQVGEEIQMIYNPKDPSDFKIGTKDVDFSVMGVGLVFVFLGVFAFISAIKDVKYVASTIKNIINNDENIS